jgi:hypothetical protein
MEALLNNIFTQVQTLGTLGAALSFAWGGILYYTDTSKGKGQAKATIIGLILVVSAEAIKNSIVGSL